ncbi:MAG: hypothetical protein JNM71_12670 [Flavobacterium lindanitolerans]|uniref:hypothetical protein n=1 Tax=Flavobacterium lindanitolerans TaxID=428988 RepID=UPI001A4EF096|nr:hypothetical protein [Flavobacterium lindanitolerans]MBL7868860.1 hypothetical protein [Flavobacterium lindanitolerans]
MDTRYLKASSVQEAADKVADKLKKDLQDVCPHPKTKMQVLEVFSTCEKILHTCCHCGKEYIVTEC